MQTIKCKECGHEINIALGTFGFGMPKECPNCKKILKSEVVSNDWSAKEKNQCDGCQLGLPVDKNGNHNYSKEGQFPNLIGCTKDRYKEEKCDIAGCKEYCKEGHGRGCTCDCHVPKDDWETKEREASNVMMNKNHYGGCFECCDFEKMCDNIADYWLARIRAAREEAVSAYKQEVIEKILGLNYSICSIHKEWEPGCAVCKRSMIPLGDLVALLRAP